MKACIVIPARYASTRFPGKPLAKIAGKEMILWTVEGAMKSQLASKWILATDHSEIQKLAEENQISVVMTDSHLPTGTDRVWAAVQDLDYDVVVNVQGDEPLIDGKLLDLLISSFSDPEVEMATLGRKFRNMEELNSETTAKIALDYKSNAIYFSRFPIPCSREKESWEHSLKHIGIYAYRKSCLKEFCQASPCDLEKAEGLEQLRALYLGKKIRVIEVESDSWGVDVPGDILKIEKLLEER